MFGISGFELMIIMVFALIIFGPDKMPDMARTVGKALRTFKSAQEDMEKMMRAEMITGGDSRPAPLVTSASTPAAEAKAPTSQAAAIWAATEEDEEEEEDEE